MSAARRSGQMEAVEERRVCLVFTATVLVEG
jgi:hypothetical protein